jgi:hypothetical protein
MWTSIASTAGSKIEKGKSFLRIIAQQVKGGLPFRDVPNLSHRIGIVESAFAASHSYDVPSYPSSFTTFACSLRFADSTSLFLQPATRSCRRLPPGRCDPDAPSRLCRLGEGTALQGSVRPDVLCSTKRGNTIDDFGGIGDVHDNDTIASSRNPTHILLSDKQDRIPRR